MKRLKIYILLFVALLSLPLSYVVWRAHAALVREERSQARFFAEALLDEMQQELSEMVRREEARAVDEYRRTMAAPEGGTRISPLALTPLPGYIVGYLQNNPDGSFESPLAADPGQAPAAQREVVQRLQEFNEAFNHRKAGREEKPAETAALPEPAQVAPPPAPLAKDGEKEETAAAKESDSFAGRYLSKLQRSTPKQYLGSKGARLEAITPEQAVNLAKESRNLAPPAAVQDKSAPGAADRTWSAGWAAPAAPEAPGAPSAATAGAGSDAAGRLQAAAEERFQVEVAPLQSVFVDDGHVFIFRRVAAGDRIYRQGFILAVAPFLSHLAAAHFTPQPLAAFSRLSLRVMDRGRPIDVVQAGRADSTAAWSAGRIFPAPFDFLGASLQGGDPPASSGRRNLDMTLAALSLIMLLGLLAIYHSARAVVDLSERRSGFVSSVTHELKTPLTTIRMYIEMLAQGVAGTPQREQEYLQVLEGESARLSTLVDNVLELSRLEKKQRRFNLAEADAAEVLRAAGAVMAHKLRQEGFSLQIEAEGLPPVRLDREVVIQVLVNLIENSIKFGRRSAQRRITLSAALRDGWLHLCVADTGPGIPRHALNRIFDDFYRVESDLVRTAGGTGIGLALVRKFAQALGGRVSAANNGGAGCTITVSLPAKP